MEDDQEYKEELTELERIEAGLKRRMEVLEKKERYLEELKRLKQREEVVMEAIRMVSYNF